MERLLKSKKGVTGWLFGFLLCFLLVGIVVSPMTVYATTADDSEIETVGDLYDVTTALTAYVNNVVGANSNDKHNNQRVENPGNVGNAGAYVGYGDEDQDFVSFITSNTTIGASASTYDAWENIIAGGNSNAAYAYVRLGRTLADAGLDETMSASSGAHYARWIFGGISMLVYTAAEIVPLIFGLMLTLLDKLNIFRLFSRSTAWSGYWKSAFPGTSTTLAPLTNFISNTYSLLVDKLSWHVIVPLMFAFMMCSILLLRKKASTQIANFVKRVTFIAIGIPICAGLYTAALDKMVDVTTTETASAKLVAASFVDFEAWASQGLPMSTSWASSSPKGTDGAVNDGGTASADMLRSLRTTALTINKRNVSDLSSVGSIGNTSHSNLSGEQWNMNGKQATGSKTPGKVQSSLFSLLSRYVKGDLYTSSAWATHVANGFKSYSSQMGDTSNTDGDTIRAMFDGTDEMNDWMRREQADNRAIWSGGGSSEVEWAGKAFNIFNNGTMTASGSPTSVMTWSGKLSDVSMYNYLSTAFGESSIVTYSNETSVSEHTKQAHASVTMIGNGILGVLFMLNMWICIGVVAVVGCYFAVSMAFKNIKTGVKLLGSIPMASLGVVKSIAQVIVYAITMIAQLFLGAFMYSFVAELLVVFAAIIENLVANTTGFADGSTNLVVLFGGRVGTSGLNIDPDMLYHTHVGIYLMLAFEIGMVLYAGYALMKYRRAFARVYSMAWYKVYQMVTCNELQAELTRVWNDSRNRQRVLRPVDVPVCVRPSAFSEICAFLKTDNNLGKEVLA